jgi:hypothetical protein
VMAFEHLAGRTEKLVVCGASAKGRNCTPSRQLRNLTPPVAASPQEPRQWRTDADDKRDAERAEAERLRDGGKHVVSIGWGDGGKTIEDEARPETSSKD